MNRCVVYANMNHESNEYLEDIQEEWEHKWEDPIIWYDVIGECRTIQTKKVKRALNLAMTTWDIEIPTKFKPVWMTRRNQPKKIPNITIDFKSSEEEKYFKDKPSVLAFAYFPGQGQVSGKVVFNNDYIWSTNGKGISGKNAKKKGWIDPRSSDTNEYKTFNIIHVLIHELGHSLGLRHDAHNDTKDVMDPYYSGKLGLSDYDILRIRQKYGVRIWKKWSWYGRVKRVIESAKLRL